MVEVKLIEYTDKLMTFISRLEFEPITQRTPYNHMGATIIDAVLQAGLNYRNVVYPRVYKLLNQFSDYTTTSDFLILMKVIPLPHLIEWKNQRKLDLVEELTWIFFNDGVESEKELAKWISNDENIERLISMKGIGPKTIDYLKMLSGNQAIPIDRHLFKFLEMAGIFNCTYHEASHIYSKVAEIMNISKYELDKKIWIYMS